MTLQENKEKSVRDHLIEEIEKSVVGPYGGAEEVMPKNSTPIGTYWSGVLHPEVGGTMVVHEISNEDNANENSALTDDDQLSEFIPNAGLKLSSFGLTCSIKESVKKIMLEISYGKYKKTQIQRNNKNYIRYQRKPFKYNIPLELTFDKSGKIIINESEKIFLKYYIRKYEKSFLLTIFFLNKIEYAGDHVQINENCIFQPKVKIQSIKVDEKIFIDMSNEFDKVNIDDPDSMLFGLLFNSKRNFAIGHSCSVEWDVNDTKDNSVTWIQTTFMPKYEIPVIEPKEIELDCLYMKNIYQVKNFQEFDSIFAPLVNHYEKWITNNLKANMDKIPKGFEDTAKNQIKKCEEALQRIKNGIKIISSNPKAGEAFVFANRSMYLQRAHGSWAKRNQDNNGKVNGTGPSNEDCENIKWRLFQLAFILLNIESITNPKSKDRSIADVLWFATGGGKTEAYLGLIAFTLAHRRLRDSDSNDDLERYGVTVIMRYTLRLLTLQQFQRAALLMCACESIRRIESDPKTRTLKWGDEPFYVGLWVGANTTPNNHNGYEGSVETIQSIRNGNSSIHHNPIQLLSCPWCGSTLDAWNYNVTGKIDQCRVNCSNKKCMFASNKDDESLPVLIVDEDIYSRCPSLIIGTVDKFAQVSWREKTASIFGYVDRYCPKHGFVVTSFMNNGCNHKGTDNSFPLPNRLCPPDLIIQDELHLISGPLGTLTGLYETVIDVLCTKDEIRPKIIASTATTKKANEQIKKLFDRDESRIFPPQGFSFGDSFFAREVPISEKRGKIYLGICATSRSGITIQGKIAASILRKVRYLYEKKNEYKLTEDEIDQFYTLVAYFNVLKELGNASKMYADTVPGLIDAIHRKFENNDEFDDDNTPKDHIRHQLNTEELTSRKSSDQIPHILKELEVKLHENNKKPLDVLLCTNMLSVGIDISRLGIMIINGQPKNHSEYIQVSGRIGREFPGLIVTNYSFLKPKDLSHYENFILYHSTFHKNVESVSLTPFSSRARDRSLNGVIIALVRVLEKRLAQNNNAQSFDITQKWIDKIIKEIRDKIEHRVNSVDKLELKGTMNDFDIFIKHWHDYATQKNPLQYKENKHDKARKSENKFYLMRSDYNSNFNDDSVFVPNSLRDAEQSAKLKYFADDSIGGRSADE